MRYYIVKTSEGKRVFQTRGQWLTPDLVKEFRQKGYIVYIEK